MTKKVVQALCLLEKLKVSNSNLRPSNILLNVQESELDIQLIDFSQSFNIENQISDFESNKDQWSYLPPEVI